tara:strand:- start:289 stop:630 length:342 start_codon:yes stop_codon:yes gene_type:complete
MTDKKFYCVKCNFSTDKQSNYNLHLQTMKHIRDNNTIENSPCIKYFKCDCGKTYKHQSSLSNHKKVCKCIDKNNLIQVDKTEYENLILNYQKIKDELALLKCKISFVKDIFTN